MSQASYCPIAFKLYTGFSVYSHQQYCSGGGGGGGGGGGVLPITTTTIQLGH